MCCVCYIFLNFRQLFGEGLNWAGCALVYLLGQQRRYELLDFTYHMLRVHKVDQQTETHKGVVSVLYYTI